jgi:hypothetical protein
MLFGGLAAIVANAPLVQRGKITRRTKSRYHPWLSPKLAGPLVLPPLGFWHLPRQNSEG